MLAEESRTTAASVAALISELRRATNTEREAEGTSIAVLPFANMSVEKENEYSSDGLAEEIINALTQIPNLSVVARTSSFAFRGKEQDIRGIGEVLKVAKILEGSVRKAGNRMRVTAQLSPEQTRGKMVDKRADVWAFGVVLYEMVTGKPLFEGQDLTETLASVLMKEPDLTAAPIQLRRLLRRCLEKDPKHRLRDIGDAQLLLDGEETRPTAPARWRVGAIVAAAIVLGAVALAGWLRTPQQFAGSPEDLSVSISPEAGAIDSISNLRGTPQISPDGSAVVYSSSPQAQMVPTAGMHFRRLNSLDIHTTKTTGIRNLGFWAPDSKTFVFADSNSLRKIRLPDGAAETVANGRVAKRKGWTLSGHDIRPEGFRDRNRRPTGVDSNSPPYTR